MQQLEPRAVAGSCSGLATLEAMARLARQSASVISVVVSREPGVVDTARRLASHAGLALSVDLMPRTIRVRFDGQLKPA